MGFPLPVMTIALIEPDAVYGRDDLVFVASRTVNTISAIDISVGLTRYRTYLPDSTLSQTVQILAGADSATRPAPDRGSLPRPSGTEPVRLVAGRAGRAPRGDRASTLTRLPNIGEARKPVIRLSSPNVGRCGSSLPVCPAYGSSAAESDCADWDKQVCVREYRQRRSTLLLKQQRSGLRSIRL